MFGEREEPGQEGKASLLLKRYIQTTNAIGSLFSFPQGLLLFRLYAVTSLAANVQSGSVGRCTHRFSTAPPPRSVLLRKIALVPRTKNGSHPDCDGAETKGHLLVMRV